MNTIFDYAYKHIKHEIYALKCFKTYCCDINFDTVDLATGSASGLQK